MNQNQKNKINLIRAVLTNELSNTQITNLELLCEKYNDTNIINKFEKLISTLETIQEQSIREIQEYLEFLKLKPYKYYSIFSTIAVPAYKIAGFPFLGMGVVEMNDDIKSLCVEFKEGEFLNDSDYETMYNICKEYKSKHLLTQNNLFSFILLDTIYKGYIDLKNNFDVA